MLLAAAEITAETSITIGAAGAIIVSMLGAAAWLHALIAKVDGSLEAISVRLKSLEDAKPGNYTLAAASEQAFRMAMANPGLKVPDPRDPRTIISVTQPSCADG